MSRGGSIDGVRERTISDIAAKLGVSVSSVSRWACSFTFMGHAIQLDPPRACSSKERDPRPRKARPKKPPKEADRQAMLPPHGPVDFTARALSDRKRYDEHGVALRGLLTRRPA